MPLSSVLGAQSITKPGVCTSTTRPSSPFDGQVIYETDTDTLAVYDGAGWVSLNPVNRDRNVVINGAMQIAQRGTSTANMGTAGGYFTADRWNSVFAQALTTARFTQSVENDAPTGSGFRKSLRFLTTTASSAAAGDRVGITQTIEGQNLQHFLKGTASAKQFTLSFWVKSNLTGTYTLELGDIDNTRAVSASYTVISSGVWEQKTITFPADTTGAFDNDNAASLNLNFFVTAGTSFTSGALQTTWASIVNANRNAGQVNLFATLNNYWQVTGVQLEAGAVATPFEFEDHGTTLAKCQRYYYRVSPGAAVRMLSVGGQCVSTTVAVVNTSFPTKMRTRPTAIEQTGTAANYSLLKSDGARQACSAVPTFEAYTTTDSATTLCTVASGLVAGNATMLSSESTDAYLAWSAEL